MAGVEVGLVGLPNSGKSTLFNALAGGGAVVAPHMFSTVETVQGLADVRDPRLEALDAVSSSQSGKLVPATLQVLDIAGLVRGASHGEGLGNQFLGSIRNTDAVVHVLRCFHDDSVAHPAGRIDPLEDAETVELELIFADLAAIERRAERVGKAAKGGEAAAVTERAALDALREWLEEGRPARTCPVESPPSLDLLTAKPEPLRRQRRRARRARPGCGRSSASPHERGSECIAVNAKIEAELRELPPERRRGVPGRPWHRAARARPGHARRLPPARPHPLLHHRAEGDAGVDDPPRPERAAGGRPDPHRPGARVHPRRGDRVGPAGRGRVGDRGQATRVGAGRRPRLRRRRRRHAEHPLQRLIGVMGPDGRVIHSRARWSIFRGGTCSDR